jgi:hypothetical protein
MEALSRALSIHKGAVPDPISVLNTRAVDPLTAAVRSRPLLTPKQSKGIRVSEATDAYFADRNRQSRKASVALSWPPKAFSWIRQANVLNSRSRHSPGGGARRNSARQAARSSDSGRRARREISAATASGETSWVSFLGALRMPRTTLHSSLMSSRIRCRGATWRGVLHADNLPVSPLRESLGATKSALRGGFSE